MMSDKNVFTVTWNIENFSLCAVNYGKEIKSLEFTVEMLSGSKWRLGIFPTGTVGFISCFLYRSYCDSFPEKIEIMFSITLIGKNGEIVLSKNELRHSFLKNDGFGYFKAISLDEMNKKMKKWADDTLIIQCHMKLPENRVTGCQMKTKVCHNWWYEMWHVKFSDSTDWTASNLFSIQNILPVVITLTAPEDLILVQIRKEDSVDGNNVGERRLTCRIYLIDNVGVERCSKTSSRFLDKDAWKFQTSIRKSFLKANKKDCMTNNTFKLKVEFSVPNLEGTISSEIERYYTSDLTTNDIMTTQRKELHAMCLNQKFSDVTLKVGEESIPSHKLILAARSPVFERMFDQDMLGENRTGVVNLLDMNADILKSFLQFMYSGTVDNMDYEKAIQLLVVSDKYEVQTLKKKCSLYLISVLCIKNVQDVLVKADLVQDEPLKSSALDYIVTNGAQILPSSEWIQWVEKNVKLAAEVFAKFTLKLELNSN